MIDASTKLQLIGLAVGFFSVGLALGIVLMHRKFYRERELLRQYASEFNDHFRRAGL